MATHSSILAWRIPWTEEPGGYSPWGRRRVGYDLATKQQKRVELCPPRRYGLDLWVRKIPWRKKWQPTPVFVPGESLGQRSLVVYSLWGHKESDMTECLN